MKNIITIIWLSIFTISNSYGQTSFKIDKNIIAPDLSVEIGENIIAPDITIEIGENVIAADLSVGLTSDKRKANFVIVKYSGATYEIEASLTVISPDISIEAGANIMAPNLTVEIKEKGIVDYLVYTENEHISLNELVIYLLPAINKKLNYKYSVLRKIR